MKKDTMKKLFALGAAVTAAAAAGAAYGAYKRKKSLLLEEKNSSPEQQFYIAGGSLASMAAAMYLVRDCKIRGRNIHIFEPSAPDMAMNLPYSPLRERACENLFDLLFDVPSIEIPDISVGDEILNFSRVNPIGAKARLIDHNGIRLNAQSFGLNGSDRRNLTALLKRDERVLGDRAIKENFEDSFFETNFWKMAQSEFMLTPESPAADLRRAVKRNMFELPSFEKMDGITSAPYSMNDSVIMPLRTHLENMGVEFKTDCVVTDVEFADDSTVTVEKIHLTDRGTQKTFYLNKGDIFFLSDGPESDRIHFGGMDTPVKKNTEKSAAAKLWMALAEKKEELGSPEKTFEKDLKVEGFTLTMLGNGFLKKIEEYSGNRPGNGGLMTFSSSAWGLSIFVPAQPYFVSQDENISVLEGFGLYPDKEGDFIQKPMRECSGEEILCELIYHLHWQDHAADIEPVSCIPYMMSLPQFAAGARAEAVPANSTNFAVIGTFASAAKEVISSPEYAVRTAKEAVYTLMNVKNNRVIPVTPWDKRASVIAKTIRKLYS